MLFLRTYLLTNPLGESTRDPFAEAGQGELFRVSLKGSHVDFNSDRSLWLLITSHTSVVARVVDRR